MAPMKTELTRKELWVCKYQTKPLLTKCSSNLQNAPATANSLMKGAMGQSAWFMKREDSGSFPL